MRRQSALSTIGCGSLGLLALVAGGCSSSTKSATDSGTGGTDGAAGAADVRTDVGTDVPKDTGVDRGNDVPFDRPADVATDVSTADVSPSICTGVAPSNALIANFDDFSNTTFGVVGDPVVGGTYVVSQGLSEDFAGQAWHLAGPVSGNNDYFGLSWHCMAALNGGCTLDVSKYSGIQFTIKGTAGPDHSISFTLGRADNDTIVENYNCGTCVAPADAATSETACHGPRVSIDLGTDPTVVKTVTLHWADFVGGSPKNSADPSQMTGILWYFHTPTVSDGGSAADAGADAAADGAISNTYPAEVTIDNLTFLPY